MIDVQPYIYKLEVLKEWVSCLVDNQPFMVWMDLQVCPTSFYIKNKLPIPRPYQTEVRAYITFEEYFKFQQQ
jgi:hypothetical protein